MSSDNSLEISKSCAYHSSILMGALHSTNVLKNKYLFTFIKVEQLLVVRQRSSTVTSNLNYQYH